MDKESSNWILGLVGHEHGGEQAASHLVCEHFVEAGATTEKGSEQVLGLNPQVLRGSQVDSQTAQLDDIWIQAIHEFGQCELAIAWRNHFCVFNKIAHIEFY